MGNAIRQTHVTNSDDVRAPCQRQLFRHGRVSSHNLFTNHAITIPSPRSLLE
ncbi:MAG: hypothetical protein JWQ49_3808 [Edaphobacter sp.]|nr:hypothetical protein [Edaphobacter sp.]